MSGQDIRAGKAFVELGVKDQLTKALKGIGKQIAAFGKGVEAIGKKFALLGGAITAPMLAATASWAASGAEMYRLTQKTGMSAEALSALSFAAEESGGSAENMTQAVRKMNMAIAEGERGSAEMVNAFAQLGLSVDQLKAMSPDQQFAAMADKVSRIKDPAQQAAFATKFFGREAMELMPLLKQGSAGLAKYRAEAEELGQIKSTEATKAAFDLDMAWKRLGGSLNIIKGAIGSALAPMLEGIAKATTTIARQVQLWLKNNQPLVKNLFMLGGALLGVGTGLAISGKFISIFGGMFGSAAKLIGVFSSALGIVGSVLGFLLSPIGILTAAIIGLGVWFLYSSGLMDKAIDWLKGLFGNLVKDAKEDFGAIADALEAGDISLAWKVVTAQMKVWWNECCLWFRERWEDFKTWFFKTSPGLAKGLINSLAAIGTFFSDLVTGIMQTWNKAVTTIAHGLVDLAMKNPSSQAAALILGENPMDQASERMAQEQRQAQFKADAAGKKAGALMHDHHDSPEYKAAAAEQDAAQARADELAVKIARYNELVEATNKQWFTGSKEDKEAQNLLRPYLDEIAAGTSKNLDEDAKAFADKTEKAGAARDAAIAKAQDAWLHDVDTGNASGKDRVAESQKWVADAQAELKAAQAAAHAAGAKAREKKKEKMQKPDMPDIDAMLGGRSTVSGTFSAAAAAGMGGAKTGWQKLADHAKHGNAIQEQALAVQKGILAGLKVGN
jgi:hypothetical protein